MTYSNNYIFLTSHYFSVTWPPGMSCWPMIWKQKLQILVYLVAFTWGQTKRLEPTKILSRFDGLPTRYLRMELQLKKKATCGLSEYWCGKSFIWVQLCLMLTLPGTLSSRLSFKQTKGSTGHLYVLKISMVWCCGVGINFINSDQPLLNWNKN